MSFRDRLSEVGDAIEYAAATLPEGYVVVIQIQKGAGFVELQDPNLNVVPFSEYYRGIAEDVKNAADAAHRSEFPV